MLSPNFNEVLVDVGTEIREVYGIKSDVVILGKNRKECVPIAGYQSNARITFLLPCNPQVS